MNAARTWRWILAAVLLAAHEMTARADDLVITSFGGDGMLVFQTPANGSVDNHYRIDGATSVVSEIWTSARTVSGVGPSASVTNIVWADAPAMFYRVVATSNSATFVDGPYLAVDVSGGTSATNYTVAYYPNAAAVPGGITNEAYKTTQILMRCLPKGTFTMGTPSNELGRDWDIDESQHQVTLSKDFYVGVFEVTQKQWERVMGNWPSYFTNVTYRDTRPVEQVSYYDIREDPANSEISPNWPQSSQVHTGSFMGKLRAKTGLTTIDLPTESQWEYACRAGTATALNSGYNLTSTSSDPRMDVVGRYWYNGGSGYSQGCTQSAGTAAAGSYLPNAWGLYDMHGNVWEWCLDWYGTYPGTVTDPVGAPSGSYRVGRGGSWNVIAGDCRSAFRYGNGPSNRSPDGGFRLARTLPDRYQLVAGTRTWSAAKAHAESQGGHLATITSLAEWNEIDRQLGAELDGKDIWLGGTDSGTEGNWRWITGEPWTYSRWYPGQPDNYGNAEHYLQITYLDSQHRWNDLSSSHSIPYYLIEFEE